MKHIGAGFLQREDSTSGMIGSVKKPQQVLSDKELLQQELSLLRMRSERFEEERKNETYFDRIQRMK